MEPKYELIMYEPESQFVLYKANQIQTHPHWHRDLELVYVIEGRVSVSVSQLETEVNECQLAVINPGQVHAIYNDPNFKHTRILILQINEYLIRSLGLQPSAVQLEMLIDLNASDSSAMAAHQCFTEMLEESERENGDSLYQINMICHRLLSILIRNYQLTTPPNSELADSRSQKHIRRILNYIDENYSEEICLNDVAKHMGITTTYLSRLFSANTNTTLTKYLNALRVEKVQRDLLETNDSITDIYLRHGFNSAKTFNRVFRNILGISPREYRSSKRPSSDQRYLSDYYTETSVGTYVTFQDEVPLSVELIDDGEFVTKKPVAKHDSENDSTIRASYGHILSYWQPYYRKVVGTGRAHDMLLANWREHFEICQNEIGFRHIRFHGMLNEEIGIIKKKFENTFYNFHYVDVAFDYLISQAIKPYIELSFMPDSLKSGQETIFHYRANITMPRSMNEWSNLVAALVKHLISRYSLKEVRSWHFEVWNEPDMLDFFAGGFTNYLLLYEATYHAIKGVDSQLLVGGPSASSMIFHEQDKLTQFLSFLKKKGMSPDFVSLHPYPVSLAYSGKKIVEKMHRIDYVQKGFEWARQAVDASGFKETPLHMNEWNASPRSDDYVHDTAFMATYVIDTIINCANQVDVLAWWTVSDIFHEAGTVFQEFGGGFGLINRSGLKKPQFFGLWALSRLSNQILCQGKDYIVTQSDAGLQALFWNHSYYNERYASGDKSQLTYYDRYNVFEETLPKKFNLRIDGLPNCTCNVKKSHFDRLHGSIFDFWLDKGAIEYMKPDQLNLMLENNHLKTELDFYQLTGELELEANVNPHGFVLYEIHFN